MTGLRFVRRARPALGTIVELGARAPDEMHADAAAAWGEAAFRAAWDAIGEVEREMSAFDPASDVARFNVAPAGAALRVSAGTAAVLRAAADLARESDGLFDPTLGTGAGAWALAGEDGAAVLHKIKGDVRLDLGGIAKGYAVDRAFEALAARAGDDHACWVNAGGDLRVCGVELPVCLRDERGGGARPWMRLREGALATSDFGPATRARLGGAGPACGSAHVSVLSPSCLFSDALTKVVARSGRTDHPSLASHEAVAWLHPDPER
jgi:thiamine biosynthesis lipoprotein